MSHAYVTKHTKLVRVFRDKSTEVVFKMPVGGNPLRGIDDVELNGTGLKIGLVVARWNPIICGALMDGAINTLKEKGV